MDRNWEPRNNWNGPPRQDWRQMDMPHPPLPPPPQFDFSSFNIPRGPQEGHSYQHTPQYRSPMEGCDYEDNFEPPDQRKRRMPYRGPAPHRNPAPGPLGLTGPWQEGGGGPRPPVFNRRGRGGFNRGFGHSNRPPFPNNNGQPPMMDFPKTRKPSPYNMSVNPEGIVDVGAAKQKLLESVLQDKDKGLPKELLDKFSPLKCDLCNAKMNSNSMAKLHYSGKNHEKKVRLYMNNLNGGEAGSSAPKKAKLESKSTPPKPMLITANLQLDESSAPEKDAKPMVVDSSAVIESQKMECLSCNVSFTSPVQASQHFMSKNHARKLRGLDPKNAKYYNTDTGEWQVKPVPLLPEDKTGRFGIGEEFLQQANSLPAAFGGAVTKLPEINKSLKVYCDVCDCYTTSQEQMQTHLKGSRHQKKSAAKQKSQAHLPQGIFLEEPAPDLSNAMLPPATKDQKKGAKKPGEPSDLSNFRTPSGLYYCSICNISVNSESQFKTHSESKKHKAKSSTAKTPELPVPPKNDSSWKPTSAKEEDEGTSSSFGLVPVKAEFNLD